MKAAVLGALVGAGLVVVVVGALDSGSEVFAQRPAPPYYQSGGDELIALPVQVGDSGQVVTVIDPRLRTMSVYYVDLATGKIALKSVRNIHWDLQMSYWNCESPLPQEIRTLLEQR